MTTLDSSIVNIGLPSIARAFNTPLTGTIEWVIIGYLVVIASLLLTFGRLSDMVGRTPIWTAGLGCFALGSAICGGAPSLGLLIAARAVQGVGAALILATSTAILTDAVPKSQRGQALGYSSAAIAFGFSAGPTVGGLLVEYLSWRWIFYVNVPIGLGAILATRRLLPRTKGGGRRHFDATGALLLGIGIASLALALSFGPSWGWTSIEVLGSLTLGAGTLIGALFAERRVAEPLIDLRLFRDRRFAWGLASLTCSILAAFAVSYLLPFYFEELRGFSTVRSGLLLTPFAIGLAVVSPIAGRLADRRGSRWLAPLGLAIVAIGLALLSQIDATTSAFDVAWRLAIAGIGQGAFQSPNTRRIMDAAPSTEQGQASGLLATARMAGQAMSVGVAGAVFASLGGAAAGSALLTNRAHSTLLGVREIGAEATFVHAFQTALLVCAVFAAVGTLIALMAGRRAPVKLAILGALLLYSAGCVGVPRVNGTSVAPSAPNHAWRPPRDAVVHDSLRSDTLPQQLAARVDSLTLPDIVDLALRNNPVTRQSWAQARIYADAYGVARGALFPALSASVSATRSEQSSGVSNAQSAGTGTSIPGSGSVSGWRSTLAPSASLSYTVLDFGTRSGNVASARETAYAMSFTHNATIQRTVLVVEQAFYSYVAARSVLEAQAASLRQAEASYRAAAKRDSVGMATRADVLQARTAVAQAQLALDTAQAQVNVTRTQLAVAFGLPVTAQYDVVMRSEDVNVSDVTMNVQSLIDEALRRRPDLQAVQASVRAARADVRAARGAMLPSLGFSATSGYNWSTSTQLDGRNYSLSFGLSIPVFDGLAYQYGVSRATAGVDYEVATADALRQSVAADVVTSYYQVQSAAQQVRTTDELFASASASMDVALARYRAGVGSLIDLLTAQTSLASARAQRAASRWMWAQQLAALAYAAGALDERGTVGVRLTGRPIPPR